MKPEMTRELALAAAKDAANNNAKENGHRRWSVDDYNLAVEVFNHLWPEENDLNDGGIK